MPFPGSRDASSFGAARPSRPAREPPLETRHGAVVHQEIQTLVLAERVFFNVRASSSSRGASSRDDGERIFDQARTNTSRGVRKRAPAASPARTRAFGLDVPVVVARAMSRNSSPADPGGSPRSRRFTFMLFRLAQSRSRSEHRLHRGRRTPRSSGCGAVGQLARPRAPRRSPRREKRAFYLKRFRLFARRSRARALVSTSAASDFLAVTASKKRRRASSARCAGDIRIAIASGYRYASAAAAAASQTGAPAKKKRSSSSSSRWVALGNARVGAWTEHRKWPPDAPSRARKEPELRTGLRDS